VARVISNINIRTAQSPSFGMPAYGHAVGAFTAVPASAVASVSTSARVSLIGGMALATKGDFPGIRAWRPPGC
jgi:predicted lipase